MTLWLFDCELWLGCCIYIYDAYYTVDWQNKTFESTVRLGVGLTIIIMEWSNPSNFKGGIKRWRTPSPGDDGGE